MTGFASPVLEALTCAALDPCEVERIVLGALQEDLVLGSDVTTEATVPAAAMAGADIVTRAAGIVAGVPVALAVFDLSSRSRLSVQVLHTDGDTVAAGDAILRVTGPLRSLLTAERTMLNLLCHLSGIATLTSQWVDEVAGTGARIRDTRKTLPGLRHLQKYAVRCGGGLNHRMALGDAALVKDNHISAAGGITAAVHSIRARHPNLALKVECDTLDQVAEAIAAGATELLLDNMSTAQMRSAAVVARSAPGVRLEASGGLTLARARAVAETGVDYLAVGALTHSAPALDIGLDMTPE